MSNIETIRPRRRGEKKIKLFKAFLDHQRVIEVSMFITFLFPIIFCLGSVGYGWYLIFREYPIATITGTIWFLAACIFGRFYSKEEEKLFDGNL